MWPASSRLQPQTLCRLPASALVHHQHIDLPLPRQAQRALEFGDEHHLGQGVGQGATVRGDSVIRVRFQLKPSDALAAVIGNEPVGRPQVIKKLWDYIKAEGLQDAANKRAINADAKLLPVFGREQVTMFELAGIVGKHLS
jgi:hypothetical protein